MKVMTSVKRGFVILSALLIAMLMVVVVITVCEDKEPEVTIPVMEAQAIGQRPLVPYLVYLETEDLEADEWCVLVDLSDYGNFPHARTNVINLKQIQHGGVLSETTHWDIRFGVVITVGTTLSQVEWFHTDHRLRTTQWHWVWDLPEHGLSLEINGAGDALQNVASVEYTVTNAITTSTNMCSPVKVADSVTTTIGIGDLIVYFEETEASGYLDHSTINVAYNTE